MSSLPESVCVITQPARRESGKGHAHSLLEILSAITSVSLLTANLSPDATVREEYSVTEFSTMGIGDSVPVNAIRFAINQFRLCRAIISRDEPVVLFFGATAYLLPIVFARLLGRPTVLVPRGDVALSIRLNWERHLPGVIAQGLAGLIRILEFGGFFAASAIVTYSPGMADQLGVRRFEYKLYTYGARFIDTSRFEQTVPYDDRDDVVGFVGRLDDQKGIPTLVDLARELPSGVRFVFVGDGDHRSMVETTLAEQIDRGQVEVTGWVDHDDIPHHLNQMRLLVMASRTEGLPTSILEAFACGTPACAPPVGGVPDLIRDGETGLLWSELDATRLADRIAEALQQAEAEVWSENCRQLVEDRYTFDAAVRRYTDILTEISARHG